MGVIDPHVPFEPGAIPVCSSDIPLVMSSVGPTLCDHHGAKESLVARSVVERMGPQFVSQSVCDKKFGGEGGGGSAVHTTSTSLAKFTFTIQYAYLPARFNVAGAVPFPSEVGATIEAYVVDDDVLSKLQGGLAHKPVLLLGREALKLPALEGIFQLVLSSQFDPSSPKFVALWTYSQQQRTVPLVRGTQAREIFQGPAFPAEIPFDHRSGDASDLDVLSPALEIFGRDGPPPAPVGVQAGTPVTKEMVRKLLDEAKTTKGAYWREYIGEVATLLAKRPNLCAPPSPRGVPLTFEVNDNPPVRSGMYRAQRPEAILPMWKENERLKGFGFVEQVEEAPGGGPPPDFDVNPLVVAWKTPDPGSTEKGVRTCLDHSDFNRTRLVDCHLTHLPNLEDYIQAFASMLLFSNLDMSQAFHQRGVPPHLRKHLGYTLINPHTGKRTYWQYCCAVYGLACVPGKFQETMEITLGPAMHVDSNTRVRIFIDNIDAASGLGGTLVGTTPPLPPPTSPAGKELAQRHLAVLDAVFEGLDKAGFSLNLKKCYFLAETWHSMGLVGDGNGHQIDPDRLKEWDLAVPEVPTLKFLEGIVGKFTYAGPHIDDVGTEFLELLGPLIALKTKGANVRRKAKEDRSLRGKAQQEVVEGWTPHHAECVRKLKELVEKNSRVAFVDYSKEGFATCDASDTGFCVTLSQLDENTGKLRVVLRQRRRWTDGQVRWSIGVRELYGWLQMLRKYHRELVLLKLRFRGDHLNHLTVEDMEHAFVKRILAELAVWPTFQQRFHIRGSINVDCDWGSRYAADAPTTLDDAPAWGPGVPPQDTYFFRGLNTPSTSTPIRRIGLEAADTTDPVPIGYGTLWDAPMQGLVEDTTAVSAVRRVSTVVVDGELVEFYNTHTPTLSPFFLEVLKAQGEEEARVEFDKMRDTKVVSIGGHKVALVKGLVFVPTAAHELRNRVFQKLLHGDGTLHCGVEKARVLLNKHGLYIPHFVDQYSKYYSSCSCQHARTPVGVRDVGGIVPIPRFAPLTHVQADFASLPPSEEGFVGVCIVTCLASRVAKFIPVVDLKAQAALMAFKEWSSNWNYPEVWHSDGGPAFKAKEFKEGVGAYGTLVDVGTAHHPRGRGPAEGLVNRLKRALRGMIPQGRIEQWPAYIAEITTAYNSTPQMGMAGYSPWEYIGVTPPGGKFKALFEGATNPQSRESAHLAVQCVRDIVDFITELSGLARAAASPPDPLLPRFAVGEWILLYCPDQVSTSLDSEYQGPYRVVFQELDATTNSPTGWFVVREILAGDTEEAPRVGPPIETHSSRMWPFDHSRTTAELEHERRLPPGHHLLERVVEGPDKDGRFLTKWLRLEKPRWEWPTAIAHTAQFKEYCETKGIVMAEGRAVQWRPSSLPPGPTITAAKPGYVRCACGKEVKKESLAKHVTSKGHLDMVAKTAPNAAESGTAVTELVAGVAPPTAPVPPVNPSAGGGAAGPSAPPPPRVRKEPSRSSSRITPSPHTQFRF